MNQPLHSKKCRLQLSVPFKSQLDNKFNPYGSCNVTSLAMVLDFYKVGRRDRSLQFEDELWQVMARDALVPGSPEHLARVARLYGVSDSFSQSATIAEAKAHLAGGDPCIVHGYFTPPGHIIAVVGYDDTRSQDGKLDGFIVHDPYGEWFPDGYRTDKSGAFLNYSYELIKRTCIPDGQFWVHFFSKP